MDVPVYKLVIADDENSDIEVDFVALVDRPAIERNFLAFREAEFVEPGPTETEDEFIGRCIGVLVGEEGYDQTQAAAICYSKWKEKMAAEKISFDYDDTLSTDRGKALAREKIAAGADVYIISARQDVTSMYAVADELGIPHDRVYATGSNQAKVEKVKALGIVKHYDNNADVIAELGPIGQKFMDFVDSITDIPDDVRSNARNAVEWADKNGWGSCGTAVGKRRASQLADPGGAVSLDTVRRMYSYLSRHAVDLENSKGYSDGCGALMYDAWGGKAGLRWSESVLKREEKLSFAIQDEDQHIITGPLMLANKPILRRDQYGEYYVYFEPDTIKQIAQKFFKKGYQSNVNLMHNDGMVVEGLTMFESWIVDKERGIKPLRGFEDVPDGSWFGSFIVDNPEVWQGIKDGKFKGFSVEGVFNYVREGKSEADIKMEKIIEILNELQ